MRRILALLMAALVGVAVAWPIRHFVVDRKPSYHVAPTPKDFQEGTKKIPFGVHSLSTASPQPTVGNPPASAQLVPGDPERLHVVGYIVRGRRFNALLSDGRTVTERDGLVSRIERNGIAMKDGQWLPILRNIGAQSALRTAGGSQPANPQSPPPSVAAVAVNEGL